MSSDNQKNHYDILLENLNIQLKSIRDNKERIIQRLSTLDHSEPNSEIIKQALMKDYDHHNNMEVFARNDYASSFQNHTTMKSNEHANMLATKTNELSIVIQGFLGYAKGFLNFLSLFSAGAVAALVTFLSTNTQLMNDNLIVKSQIFSLIGKFLLLSIISLLLWLLCNITTHFNLYTISAQWDKSYFLNNSLYESEKEKQRIKNNSDKILRFVRPAEFILEVIIYEIAIACLIYLACFLYKAYEMIQPFIITSQA